MRYAIVSDIHANLQAWNAVFLDIRSNHVDRILCLGDLIGYGPNPAEVLQAIHANVDYIVLGNHDAALCGKMDESLFTETAQNILRWTRGRLSPNAVKFLRTLPLCLAAETFRCAHGDFAQSAAFNYIIEPAEAMPSWQTVPEPLLFVGHTHQPALFLLGPSGIPRTVEPQDFELEPGKRYLVNVGSVGHPRDGEARSTYCIYDTALNAVFWRKVPFDLDAYREARERSGVPPEPKNFLNHDPRLGKPPLRDLLNFSPPSTPEQSARDVVEVQSITVLKRRVRTWRTLFVILLALAGLSFAAAALLLQQYRSRSLTIADPAQATIYAAAVAPETNMLPKLAAPVPCGQVIPGWSLQLGDRRTQNACVVVTNGETVIVMESRTSHDDFRLVSAPIVVKPGMALYPDALIRKTDGFNGQVAVVVSLVRKTKTGAEELIDQFYVKEPNQPKAGGWVRAREKFDIPAGGISVSFQIRGKFTGRVELKDLSLTRK